MSDLDTFASTIYIKLTNAACLQVIWPTCHTTFTDPPERSPHVPYNIISNNQSTYSAQHDAAPQAITAQPENPDNQHRCTICDMKFKRKAQLNTHVRKSHTQQEATEDDDEIEVDRFETSKNNDHSVGDMEVALSTPSQQTNVKYECAICGRQFAQKDNLRMHLKTIHDIGDFETFQCSYCSQVFNEKASRDEHCASEHASNTRYPCDDCDKVFDIQQDLHKHMKTVHGFSNLKRTPARDKPKRLASKRTLSLQCDLCAEMFHTIPSFYRHLSSVHNQGNNDKTFTCHICSKMQTKSMHTLTRHLESVHGLGNNFFGCETCPKVFNRKDNWIAHMRKCQGIA